MSRLIGIVAMTRAQRVIGNEGKLPWHLPEDLKFFRNTTLGHTVVMGRATFDSIGRPLPQRRNVVLSRQRDWCHAGVEVVHDVTEITRLARASSQDIYVIGGAQIYALLLPLLDSLVVTHVDHNYPGDAFFPIDPERYWSEKEVLQSGTGYEIACYSGEKFQPAPAIVKQP